MTNAEFLRQLSANHLRNSKGNVKSATRSLEHALLDYHQRGRAMLRVLIADYVARRAEEDDVKTLVAKEIKQHAAA